MKNSFLFKRGEYYHLQYFDCEENRIKRISTKCSKKNDAIKFLLEFENTKKDKPKFKFLLLSEFRKEYEETIKLKCSKKYLADVQTTFKQLINIIGDLPLNKIKPFHLEQFQAKIYSVHKYHALNNYNNLNSAFNKAILWNHIDSNPLKRIPKPIVTHNNPLFINEVELNLIIDKEDNPQLKDFYLFAFHTGMRLGEITNLKWNAVDLVERIIKVQNTETFTTKGKRERIIPINETLFSVLKNRIPRVMDINKDIYVFNKVGIKLSDEFVSKRFKKVLRQVKEINQDFHFHDLRHSFASNIAQKGISLFVIKELLGHQDIKTTQIYSHLKVDNLKEAVKVLEG